MPPAGFEHAISACQLPQTHSLAHVATGIVSSRMFCPIITMLMPLPFFTNSYITSDCEIRPRPHLPLITRTFNVNRKLLYGRRDVWAQQTLLQPMYGRSERFKQTCKFSCCTHRHNDAGQNNAMQTSNDSLQNVAKFKHRGSIPTIQNCIRVCLLPYTADCAVPPSTFRNVKMEKRRKEIDSTLRFFEPCTVIYRCNKDQQNVHILR